MNELNLQVFKSEFGQVRTVEQNKELWFIAKDVCDCLDLGNSRQALTRLDEDEKNSVILNDGTPGNPKSSVVSESGLYALVLASRKSEARQFKRWITHDVIPTIRQHGLYAIPEMTETIINDPDTMIKILLVLKEERAEKEQAHRQIEKDRPKVLFADAVSCSDDAILIGDFAKILNQNGVDIGANRLFAWLRQEGYLINRQGSDRNHPTQKSIELGLFKIKETAVTHSDGHTSVYTTSKLTGKGQLFFMDKLRNFATISREVK